jgi:hypothetical protein
MDIEGERTRCELRTQDLSINRPSLRTVEWRKKGDWQDGKRVEGMECEASPP